MAKTVLITGGSRGIGKATAILCARQGWNTAFTYRTGREEALELERLLRENGLSALAIPMDVCSREQVFAAVEQAVKHFGGLDGLVNNAGIAAQKLFTDLTEQDWSQMLEVNLTGAFRCCQAAIPWMLRRGGGSIVNLSSIWGQAGASCEVHYSASKAAVIGLTKALAKELGPSKIRVNCVAPGVIDTPMNRHLAPEILDGLRQETPLERIGTPEQVAESIFFLLSGRAEFITGQVLGVNGGFVV